MSNNNKNNLDQTRVHKDIDLNQTRIHGQIKNQDTIFGNNSRVKNEMRRNAFEDTMAPTTRAKQRRASSRDASLDFDPFLDETIYDVKYKQNRESGSSLKFIVITLIIAIIVCISVFVFAFKVVLNPNSGINSGTELNTETENGTELNSNTDQSTNDTLDTDQTSDVILAENLVSITGVIKKYDISNNTINVLDLSDDTSYSFIIDGKTKLYDQYGKTIVFAELAVGDIVDITFDSSSVYVTELHKNENSFTQKRVTGLEVDTMAKTISFNGKSYGYNDDIIVTSDNEAYDISLINKTDTVNFSGYKDTVYKIELLKGHGTISFINIEAVENGSIEIDTDTMFKLENQTESIVSAGEHNLVIKGDNIDTYTNQIFVDQNETLEIDLANLPSKKGLLTIKTNASDVEIAIDGEIYTDPILLDYGSYTVSVSAPDYETASKTVNIDKTQQELTFELKAIEKKAKIIIDTVPTGAEVYVDNRLIGLTPINQNIAIGLATLTFRLEGYDDFTYTREFEEDTYRLTFTLIPEESDGSANVIEDSTNVDEELIIP